MTAGLRAPSTSAELGPAAKLRDHLELLRWYLERGEPTLGWLFDELEGLQAVYARHAGRRFASAVEIGYGARPYRMRALHALGVAVEGVDAETPVLGNRPREFMRVLRENGPERAVKTLVRRLTFDRAELRAFERELRRRGLRTDTPPAGAFAVMDAADFSPDRPVDVVYSLNVFEHVDRASLERIVARMPGWLAPGGLALIRPDIWTGFHGGHLLEWAAETLDRPRRRRAEPWEHLRRNRFPANTHLNRLTRTDYRELFRTRFEILEEIEAPRGRAAEFLTDEIRYELAAYSEQDLLDETPLFVLRPG